MCSPTTGLSTPHATAVVEGLLAAPWGAAGEGAAPPWLPKPCEVWCLRQCQAFFVLTVCVCQRALTMKPKAKQNEAKEKKKGQTTQKPPARGLLLLPLGDPTARAVAALVTGTGSGRWDGTETRVTARVNGAREVSRLDPPHAARWPALSSHTSEEAVHRQKTNGTKGRPLIFSAGGCDGIRGLRLWL